MKILLIVAITFMMTENGSACGGGGGGGSPNPIPSCPQGMSLHTGKWTCYCGTDFGLKPTCPSGYQRSDFWCTCNKSGRMENENGSQSCTSVIQELAFKNSIGCINCATDFCLPDKTTSLGEAIKDEAECNQILACLKVNGQECGCIA